MKGDNIGDIVELSHHNENNWISGHIVAKKGNQICVQLDNGQEVWIEEEPTA